MNKKTMITEQERKTIEAIVWRLNRDVLIKMKEIPFKKKICCLKINQEFISHEEENFT